MTAPVAEAAHQEIFSVLLLELRDGLERTKRLMDAFEAGSLGVEEREEARRGARRLALEGRLAFSNMAEMLESSAELFPEYAIAVRIATRLAYCQLALADEDPEPLALISPAELETILRDEGPDSRVDELVAMVPADRQRGD